MYFCREHASHIDEHSHNVEEKQIRMPSCEYLPSCRRATISWWCELWVMECVARARVGQQFPL